MGKKTLVIRGKWSVNKIYLLQSEGIMHLDFFSPVLKPNETTNQ